MWEPKGWFINMRGTRKLVRYEAGALGISTARDIAPSFRKAESQARRQIFRAIADALDTRYTDSRVHLCIHGTTEALCGAKDTSEHPGIRNLETPACGVCERILRTIERRAGLTWIERRDRGTPLESDPRPPSPPRSGQSDVG